MCTDISLFCNSEWTAPAGIQLQPGFQTPSSFQGLCSWTSSSSAPSDFSFLLSFYLPPCPFSPLSWITSIISCLKNKNFHWPSTLLSLTPHFYHLHPGSSASTFALRSPSSPCSSEAPNTIPRRLFWMRWAVTSILPNPTDTPLFLFYLISQEHWLQLIASWNISYSYLRWRVAFLLTGHCLSLLLVFLLSLL